MYFAKTNPIETITEHTDNLMDLYNNLEKYLSNKKIKYLNWDILKIACEYHDIGKANVKFQNKLLKALNKVELEEGKFKNYFEVNHNFLSPAFIPSEILEQLSYIDKRVLFQSIYRHHKRKDVFPDIIRKFILDMVLEEEQFNFNESRNLKNITLSKVPNIRFLREVDNFITNYYYEDVEAKQDIIYKYIMTKGLLNKIDYAASSIIEDKTLEIEILPENIETKVKTFLKKISKKENPYNELQEYLIKNREENNIVIAATGFGKTEAGLLWIGENKGFFTLPLKVSINAIYDRLIKKEKINLDKNKVGLLHSDTFSEYLKRSENENDQTYFDERYYNQTKQLSLPLTICTLDQIIDSVFKFDGCELKLATLSYSKVIIDEIQMYSPAYLACLIYSLKLITDLGGKFTIMTATFPPILMDKLIDLNIPVKFCEKEFYKKKLRHRVNVFEEVININHLEKNFDSQKKYLIICNTIKKAQEVYRNLKESDLSSQIEINLLHSRFIRKDRSRKENEILELGKNENKKTGIWVTTQIVEASLDIDFDILYTELSEVNGLFQRMGRVFRNRDKEIKDDFVNVYVYVGDDKNTPSLIDKTEKFNAIDYDIFSFSKECLIENYNNKIYDYKEELKMNIVKKIYSKENLEKTKHNINGYYKTLDEIIDYIKNLEFYEKEKNALKLRDINAIDFIPIEVLKNNNCIFEFVTELKKIYESEKNFSGDKMSFKELKNKNKILKQKFLNNIKEFYVSVEEKYFNEYNDAKVEGNLTITEYFKINVGNYCYSNEEGLLNKPFDKGMKIVENIFF